MFVTRCHCRAPSHSRGGPAFLRTRGGSGFAEAGTSVNGQSTHMGEWTFRRPEHRCTRSSALGSKPMASGLCHFKAPTQAVPPWGTLLPSHLAKPSWPFASHSNLIFQGLLPAPLPSLAHLRLGPHSEVLMAVEVDALSVSFLQTEYQEASTAWKRLESVILEPQHISASPGGLGLHGSTPKSHTGQV